MKALGNTRYMQYVSAFIASLSVVSISTYVTWASPTLPKLTSSNSPIGVTLTSEEASWVASIMLIGALPGSLISGLIVEKFGRKGSLLLCSIPLFVPWIAIMFAKSAITLIIARFVGGMAVAAALTSVSMYIGEIAEKDIRGKLGTLITMLRLTGGLFVFSAGPFISYTALALCSSAVSLIFAVLFFFMPETPYYLIKSGKEDAAKNNLVRLCSKNSEQKVIDSQLDEIKATVEYDMKNKSTVWELFSKQEYRKSLIIMFGVKTLQQFSGASAIDAYAQSIIELSKSSISPEVSSIFCGLIQIPAVLIAGALVDKMGRKPLLILSSLGCAVALIGEGAYFYLQDVVQADVAYLSWLPTTALVLYLLMGPIGLFTLPYVLFGELFATNIKGIAVSAVTFYSGVMAFIVVKYFKPISDAWGMHTMFWIFAVMCILGAVFLFFVLPETKGKTFAEIQAELNNRSIELVKTAPLA